MQSSYDLHNFIIAPAILYLQIECLVYHQKSFETISYSAIVSAWFRKYELIWFINILMEEGFLGVYTPFTIFLYFWLRPLRYEKDFLQVLSKLCQASMVKIFHFSDEWKVVSVAPQRGVYTPHKSRGVFYTHIGHGN